MCVVAVAVLVADAASAQEMRVRGRRARVWDNEYPVQTVGYETPADKAASTQEMPVYVEVRTPASAEVMFDGAKTTQMGSDRFFVSPPLKPGQSFTYEIKAKWNVNGEEVAVSRTVPVHAGETVMVDLMGPQMRSGMMPVGQPQEWRMRGRRGRVWVQDDFAGTPAMVPAGSMSDERRANYPPPADPTKTKPTNQDQK